MGILAMGYIGNNVHAEDPSAFVVDVVPCSFDVNEAVDMTIKAVNDK